MSKSNSADLLFSAFVQACRQNFDPLMAEHGLTPAEPKKYGYEFVVVYESESQKVIVSTEPPSSPWVILEGKGRKGWKRKGLHQLYRKINRQEISTYKEMVRKKINQDYLFNIPLLCKVLRENWDKLFGAI